MGGKRKLAQKEEKLPTYNIKNIILVDNYKSHMELQHLAQWKEYLQFSDDEKKSYSQDPILHSK
jgi:hypothetical protein